MARDRAGHAPRAFVQMKFTLAEAPELGTKLFINGEQVGHVTSAAVSPRWGGVVALGYVKWKHRDPGTAVELETAAGFVLGEVMKR